MLMKKRQVALFQGSQNEPKAWHSQRRCILKAWVPYLLLKKLGQDELNPQLQQDEPYPELGVQSFLRKVGFQAC